jgi:hypothetical protein
MFKWLQNKISKYRKKLTPDSEQGSKFIEYIRHILRNHTIFQRQWFAIQCALKVCNNPVFVLWAKNWLNGTDRSSETAEAVSDKLWADANAVSGISRSRFYAAAKAAKAAAHATIADVVVDVANAAMYATQANPSINFPGIATLAIFKKPVKQISIDLLRELISGRQQKNVYYDLTITDDDIELLKSILYALINEIRIKK